MFMINVFSGGDGSKKIAFMVLCHWCFDIGMRILPSKVFMTVF